MTLIGAFICFLDQFILKLLFPDFNPEMPYVFLAFAILPLLAIALIVVGRRQHPLARIVRFLAMGVIVLYLMTGAIAVLSLVFVIMG